MRTLFFQFVETIKRCFSGYSFVIQLLALLLTGLIVWSGLDWSYFLATRSQSLRLFFFPALMIGTFLPILGPLALLAIGHWQKNPFLKKSAWALGQAALLGLLIAAFYKTLTGRLQPNMHDLTTDISHVFRFGLLRGGIFWGWPSSHTTIACAMSAMIAWRYRKTPMIVALALSYGLYMGIGVATVGIHWLSEAVAGVLFGSVIGFQVARSFEKEMSDIKQEDKKSS